MKKKPKRPRDMNQLAKLIVDLATGEKTEKRTKKKSPTKKLATKKDKN